VERTVELKYGGLELKNAVLSCFIAWFLSPAQFFSTLKYRLEVIKKALTKKPRSTVVPDFVLLNFTNGILCEFEEIFWSGFVSCRGTSSDDW